MSVTPPPFQSNYPRGPQQPLLGYLRPPGVYFDSIGIAWEMLKADWGVYAASTLIMFVVPMVFGMGAFTFGFTAGIGSGLMRSGGLFGGTPSVGFLALQTGFNIVTAYVTSFMHMGLVCVGLGHLQRGYPQIGDVFLPFRRIGRSWTALLIMVLPNIVISVSNAVSTFVLGSRDLGLSIILLLLLCCLSLLLVLTIYGTLYVGATASIWGDQPASVAFVEAFRRIEWKSPLLSILVLAASIVGGLGVCACGIGILFTFPIVTNVVALHYAYFFPPEQREGMPSNPHVPPVQT